MKIVAIDAGNTHLRLSVIALNTTNSNEIVHFRLDEAELKFQSLFEREGSTITVAISSVVQSTIDQLQHLFHKINHRGTVIICDHSACSLLSNNYSATLGIDRYADAVAAVHRFPHRDLIVIDSGTATTVDFIRRDRVFLGGFILPGIGLKARAIGKWTDKLPALDPYNLLFSNTPTTTIDAVASGLLIDCAGGIEKAIDIGIAQLCDPLILACGGGWEIIGEYVNRTVETHADLTLFGTALVGYELSQTRIDQ